MIKTLDKASVDLIIADPPYFQIKGDFDFTFKDVDEYIDWCKKWIKECKRILKPSGSFYLWGAIGYNRGYALPKIANWIEDEGIFIVRNWITQKNSRGNGNKKGYLCVREDLLFMTYSETFTWHVARLNETTKRVDLGANGKPRKSDTKRCTDVWDDITEASQYANGYNKQIFKLDSTTNFPTVKALELCNRIVEASSNINDTILIPFAGSGSEIISCINNNRNFIASEIEDTYINKIIIEQRLIPKGFQVLKENNIYYINI